MVRCQMDVSCLVKIIFTQFPVPLCPAVCVCVCLRSQATWIGMYSICVYSITIYSIFRYLVSNIKCLTLYSFFFVQQSASLSWTCNTLSFPILQKAAVLHNTTMSTGHSKNDTISNAKTHKYTHSEVNLTVYYLHC